MVAVATVTSAGPATAGVRSAGATAAGVISTVAGGVGGPAKASRIDPGDTCGVFFDAGHLYIAAQGTVRRVDPRTGWLTTPAGTGSDGPLGDGGRATQASFSTCSVTMDHFGNLVISDSENGHQRIRAVAAATGTFYGQAMTKGDIYTVAGTGVTGFSGDGGPAARAELDNPFGVAVDGAGNLLIADRGNSRVRVVAARSGTFYGQAMTKGDIYTVAGTGVEGFSGDGGPATSAELDNPNAVAMDGAGNLLIADLGNERVRVVAARSGTFYGQAMTGGDIYTVAGDGSQGFAGDGGPAASAELNGPVSVTADAVGNLLIADLTNSRVRVVAARSGTFYGQAMTGGDIYTAAGNGKWGFAGDGGPATSAEFRGPQDVVADAAGNLVIADGVNGRVRVVAARSGTFYGQAMTAGDIYTAAGGDTSGVSDGGLATRAQTGGEGVAVDRAGNLLIAATSGNRVQVVAAASGTLYGRAMTKGHIYIVAGTGRYGFSGDGGLATRAKLANPVRVAADSAGNLLIADTDNGRIRVVAARSGTFYGQAMTAGHVYTVAGGGDVYPDNGVPATSDDISQPSGVAVDAAGNLVISDTNHSRVRVVAARSGTFYGKAMIKGDIYTVAGTGHWGYSGDGGRATRTDLTYPEGVAVDAAGNLVIADSVADKVRVVAARSGTFYGQAMTKSHIYTVAGNGSYGFSGDGGPATSAELREPQGVAVDAAGNLVIADLASNRVRAVAARTGSFYGQAMTEGDIYTVAGNGTYGYCCDGGPAIHAELGNPYGVAADPAGNLLITDEAGGRIRMVAG